MRCELSAPASGAESEHRMGERRRVMAEAARPIEMASLADTYRESVTRAGRP